jgi:hypothetical protein
MFNLFVYLLISFETGLVQADLELLILLPQLLHSGITSTVPVPGSHLFFLSLVKESPPTGTENRLLRL